MKYVFISYVREDSDKVILLKNLLQRAGEINVWLDRDSIEPGQRWKDTIRKAISGGAYFIACFSKNYHKKNTTYMDEELAIAIEQIKLKPSNKSWFIPIRLSNCLIPDHGLGDGETLNDLQIVDFFDNFVDGVNRLLQCLVPAMSPRLYAKHILKANLEAHLKSKIAHFKNTKVHRFKEIEDRWLGLLEKSLMENLFRSFVELRERSKYTGQPQIDRVIESGDQGRLVLLSVAPFIDSDKFLNSIRETHFKGENAYIEFIISQRKVFYHLPNWRKRDFVHIIYMEAGDDTVFDILYIIDLDLRIAVFTHIVNSQREKGGTAISYEHLYPTGLMNTIEAGMLMGEIRKEDIGLLGSDQDK